MEQKSGKKRCKERKKKKGTPPQLNRCFSLVRCLGGRGEEEPGSVDGLETDERCYQA